MMESFKRLRGVCCTKKIILPAISLFIFCFIVIGLWLNKPTKTSKLSNDKVVLNTLQQIEVSLQQANGMVNQTSQIQSSTMKDMESQLHNIQAELTELSTSSSNNEIQQLITRENKEIADQLVVLSNQVKQLKQENKIKRFLSPSALPFKIISVDVWNGETQVTVKLNGTTELMAKGDIRSGWGLVDLGFSPARAIFKNSKGQLVEITLP